MVFYEWDERVCMRRVSRVRPRKGVGKKEPDARRLTQLAWSLHKRQAMRAKMRAQEPPPSPVVELEEAHTRAPEHLRGGDAKPRESGRDGRLLVQWELVTEAPHVSWVDRVSYVVFRLRYLHGPTSQIQYWTQKRLAGGVDAGGRRGRRRRLAG